MDRKEIGAKIRKLRERKGWKQGQLATQAGISPSYVPDLENGKKCPSVEVLDYVCCALGISLAEFFTDEKEYDLIDKVSALTDKQKKLLNDFLNSL